MDKRHVCFPIIFIVNQSEAAIVPLADILSDQLQFEH
jgi:hypothetical protein